MLIALLLYGADVPSLLVRFRSIDLWSLMAAILVMFSRTFAHAARWATIIRANDGHIAFAQSFKLILMGYFFNQALPSAVGGDVIRVWQARQAGLSLGTALNTVVLDRLLALAALLIMSTAALPWLMDLIIDPALRWALALVLITGTLGFAVLLVLNRLPEYVFRWRLARAAVKLSNATRKTLLHIGPCLITLVLSVAIHFGMALVVFILAGALGVKISLIHCIFLVPLVMLVSLIPISMAGWGVREGAMVVAFGLIQVPQSDAIAVSVLFGATLLLTSLPGGLLWWRSGHPTVANLSTDSDTMTKPLGGD